MQVLFRRTVYIVGIIEGMEVGLNSDLLMMEELWYSTYFTWYYHLLYFENTSSENVYVMLGSPGHGKTTLLLIVPTCYYNILYFENTSSENVYVMLGSPGHGNTTLIYDLHAIIIFCIMKTLLSSETLMSCWGSPDHGENHIIIRPMLLSYFVFLKHF